MKHLPLFEDVLFNMKLDGTLEPLYPREEWFWWNNKEMMRDAIKYFKKLVKETAP